MPVTVARGLPLPVTASGLLPAGVTTAGPDAPSQTYWANWTNTFPASSSFILLGQFPADVDPYSGLATLGVFATPMHDDQSGRWMPVQSQASSFDMADAVAAPCYIGSTFWDYAQPGVPSNATTVTACSLGLPASMPASGFTLTVASAADWAKSNTGWGAVAGITYLGQITVQGSSGPLAVNFNALNTSTGVFSGCQCSGTGTISSGANAGGAAWGSTAAFLNPGDEMDGAGINGLHDGVPASFVPIVNNNTGSWGGVTDVGFVALYNASKAIDSSRPYYLQVTGTFMGNYPGSFGSQYTLAAQKNTLQNGCDIASFDRYLVADLGVPVYYRWDQIVMMRYFAAYTKPILAFTEIGLISGYTHTATPAQVVSLNWNSIVAGGGGFQYFDGVSNANITSASATHTAIVAFHALLANIASVINSPFAYGFTTLVSGGITAPVSSTASTTLSDGSTGTHVLLGSAPSQAPVAMGSVTLQGVSGAGTQGLNTFPSTILTVNSSTDIVIGTPSTGSGTGGTAVVSPSITTHYHAADDSFYVFVAPHDSTVLSYTLGFAGITGVTSLTKVDIQTGTTTNPSTDSSGHLAITFSDVNQGCYLVIRNPAG